MHALKIVARLLATLLLIVVSLTLHLSSHTGRLALRDVASLLLPVFVPGHLSLRSIDVLTLDAIVLSGVRYADARDAPLIDEATVSVRPARALIAALTTRASFPAINVRARRLWVRVPSFPEESLAAQRADAAGVAPSRKWVFPSIELTVDEVQGALPDVPLQARGLHARASLMVGDPLTLDLRHVALTARAMGLDDERIEGALRLTFTDALHVVGALRLRGRSLDCDVEALTDARGIVSATFRDCAPAPDAIDLFAGRRLALRVRVNEAVLRGPPQGPWSLRAQTQINDQPIGVNGEVSPDAQRIEVNVRALSLARLLPDAPATDLTGTVHVEHRRNGGVHRLVFDGERLQAAVLGIPVPPLYADATLDGDVLTVREARARDVGLSVTGSIDVSSGTGSLRAEATLDTPDIARYPWVAGRAAGAVRARVIAEGTEQGMTARYEVQASQVRASGVTAASARVTGTARLRGPAIDVDATASATRLVVPGALTATEVRVRATGDPRGRVRTTVSAHGDGLLAALGPAASGATRNATHVDTTVDLDLRNPTLLRAQLQRAAVDLRGAHATITGDLALHRPEGRRASLAGSLSIRTERHGALSLSVRQGRTQATLQAFDLTWLRPLVASLPEIDGVVDGTFDVNPADLRSAHADLRIRHGRVAPIGAFDATLNITPLGGVTHLQARVDSTRGRTPTGAGAHAEVDLQVEIPRRTSETTRWIDGVQAGHIALERINLAAWSDLLPTGIGMQGSVRVGIDLTRESPISPLRVVARTDGDELTAGLRIAGRVLPIMVPLSARAVTCVEIVGGSLVNAPFEFRVALDRTTRGSLEVQSVSCGEGDLIPSRSLIAVGTRMRGPWLPAITDAARDLAQRVPRFSARTLDLLRTATLDARFRVGPIARADWPLRAIPMLAGVGLSALLRPPNVPADARAELNLSARGAIATLALEATASARSSALPQLGFSESIAADLRATLRPRAGETLLGAFDFSLRGDSDLSLDAPQPERGHITVDLRASAEGERVLERGASAVTLDALDVDASNVSIERFAWARAKRVRGVLAAHLNTTRDAQVPFAATATITGLRAAMGQEADEARETRPVQVGVGARMRTRNGGGYTLFSCVEATGRNASPSCDPERPSTAVAPGSALAAVSVPFTGELTSLRPELSGVDVGLIARSFRLEALTPLMRDDNIASVAGSLDASVRWSGARPSALVGSLHVTGGRAEVISLGEPLRDLVVDVEAADGLARISRLSLSLGRGNVALTGSADLRGLAALTSATVAPGATLVSLDLAAEARQLPMGVEGNTYGWIDGTLRYGMRFTRAGATGSLEIDRASVLMKEEQSRDLQPLGTDADVFVFGRTLLDVARSTSAYPIALRFDVLTPIWMRRSDFAVAIQGHGQVSRERGGWAVGGTIEQASPQSWISVMGKRFELDRLRVVFDGTPTINPQLDIAAHHDTATEGRLIASVGGRLRTPTMDFAAVNHPGASQAEVLALIALGRRTSQSANGNNDLGQQAAASIASLFTAMTLGGLASSVSQGGRFLPTLILEPGQGAGRYGAGISLGPRVYLQATYGATAGTVGTTSTAAQLFRVLLEVAITQSWSGSVFGAFGRSSGHSEVPFGAEFFWSP